jgi:hypothetical protein
MRCTRKGLGQVAALMFNSPYRHFHRAIHGPNPLTMSDRLPHKAAPPRRRRAPARCPTLSSRSSDSELAVEIQKAVIRPAWSLKQHATVRRRDGVSNCSSKLRNKDNAAGYRRDRMRKCRVNNELQNDSRSVAGGAKISSGAFGSREVATIVSFSQSGRLNR